MKRPHTSGFVRPEPRDVEINSHAELFENESATNVRQLGERKSEVEGVSAGALLGYARVSRDGQEIRRQLDALRDAGCVRIFTDEGVSGARASRPGLDEMLLYARPGDTIAIQALDRLGRRTADLLRLVETWREQGIGLRILSLDIDSTSPAGVLLITLLSALAENERLVLIERTRDGLAAARRRGKRGGRPPALSSAQRREALRMRNDGRSLNEIAAILGCSERTVRRVLAVEEG